MTSAENSSPAQHSAHTNGTKIDATSIGSSAHTLTPNSPRKDSPSGASSLKSVHSYQDFSEVSTPLPKHDNLQIEFPNPSLDRNDIQSLIEQKAIEKYHQQVFEHGDAEFSLDDVIPVLMEGVESIVKDSFTECFSPRAVENWNFNWCLFPIWVIGVFVRYCILVPLRLSLLLAGTSVFACVAAFIYLSGGNEEWMRWALQWFGTLWLYSINAVVRYHGIPPVKRKNQIYVSNHTSLIDFMVLSNYSIFSTVGQKHPGFIGFLQKHVVFPLRNIFFERFEFHDRTSVPLRIKEHINDLTNPPLLIFPEGVCVNNEYCVMFKKGVFEMDDVEIVPVAIKYNKLFSDPYWSSRDESFLQHMLRLMKSWCTVANVWFLEPQKRKPGESAIDFSNRVKKMIAERAGLINLHWDGYLKYYTPSQRLLDQRQKQWAERLEKTWAIRGMIKQHKTHVNGNSPKDGPSPSDSAGDLLRRRRAGEHTT
mmetsp:Transcript_11383/g.42734  ORF Transcript_11383/g.42734 Transcript_11383/m.42734 type:complete len:479 (-) Transcript_11383:1659-3095(-)